jgi:O-glycosyl hydrolase
MDGFGAGSMAYSEVWSPTTLNQFYTTTGTPGLGLTMVRIKNSANPANGGNCYGPDAGCVTNALASAAIDDITNAQNVLALNPSALIWTSAEYVPTTAMQSSSAYYLDTTANNTAWANIATAWLQLMTSYGVPIYAFSPMQEPDTGCGPPLPSGLTGSCMFPADYTNLLPYLRSAFNTAGYNSVKILLPEPCCTSGNYGLAVGPTPDSWFTPIMTGAAAADVDILANQAYGGGCTTPCGPDSFPTSAPNVYGLHYWQTEVSDDQATDDSMTSGLNYALSIHDYIANAGASSYNYWLLDCTGSFESSDKVPYNWCLNDSSGNITKRAYAMGNWSKYVRPGWVRIDATVNPAPGIYITAFKDASSGNFAIVAINQNSSPANVNFSLSGFPSVTSVTPALTSASVNLVDQSNTSVSGGTFSYSLPATSVVTFHGTSSSSSPTTPLPPTSLTVIVH